MGTYRCGHTGGDIPKARTHYCDSARERGRECANKTSASKGKSRGYFNKNLCWNCRTKTDGGPKDNKRPPPSGGSGAVTGQQTVRVGA